MTHSPRFSVERLHWRDRALGCIDLPRAKLAMTESFGSGLSRRHCDPPGHFWATGDRGPNLKIETLLGTYGADQLAGRKSVSGAKVMPMIEVGPQIAQLRIAGGAVKLVASLRVRDGQGAPVSGLPMPTSEHTVS